MLKHILAVGIVLTLSTPGSFAQDAAHPTPAQMKANYGELQADGVTAQALLDLLARSPNSYVFAVQSLLAEKSLYSGAISGLLTRSTIRAINRFCAEQDIERACQKGPLGVTGSTALSNALAEPDTTMGEPAAEPEAPAASEPATATEPTPQASSPEPEPTAETTPTPLPTVPGAAIVLPLQDGTSLTGWKTDWGTSTLVDGRYRVTSSSSRFAGRQFITFPTKVGERYTVSAEGYAGTAGATLAIGASSNITGAILVSPPLAGAFRRTFIATGEVTFLLLAATGSRAGYADFDNITITAE